MSKSRAFSVTMLIWALRALMAALFLFAAWLKLSGSPAMIEEFGKIGLGQGFRYFTALLEAAGAIVLLVPSVSVFAAALLMLIDAGALVAQLAVLHGDVIHCLVIGAVLAALIHLQRDSLAGRLVGRIDVP